MLPHSKPHPEPRSMPSPQLTPPSTQQHAHFGYSPYTRHRSPPRRLDDPSPPNQNSFHELEGYGPPSQIEHMVERVPSSMLMTRQQYPLREHYHTEKHTTPVHQHTERGNTNGTTNVRSFHGRVSTHPGPRILGREASAPFHQHTTEQGYLNTTTNQRLFQGPVSTPLQPRYRGREPSHTEEQTAPFHQHTERGDTNGTTDVRSFHGGVSTHPYVNPAPGTRQSRTGTQQSRIQSRIQPTRVRSQHAPQDTYRPALNPVSYHHLLSNHKLVRT
jgi:hypothetical protein